MAIFLVTVSGRCSRHYRSFHGVTPYHSRKTTFASFQNKLFVVQISIDVKMNDSVELKSSRKLSANSLTKQQQQLLKKGIVILNPTRKQMFKSRPKLEKRRVRYLIWRR